MRKTIKARDGYILTDGTIFGKEILLADGAVPEKFYEITAEEYAAIQKRMEERGRWQ